MDPGFRPECDFNSSAGEEAVRRSSSLLRGRRTPVVSFPYAARETWSRRVSGYWLDIVGLTGIIAAVPVYYWGLKLLRIKYGYSFPEMAELMIPIIFGLVIFGLVVCRFLGVWPF